jgi:hypothetical protein
MVEQRIQLQQISFHTYFINQTKRYGYVFGETRYKQDESKGR